MNCDNYENYRAKQQSPIVTAPPKRIVCERRNSEVCIKKIRGGTIGEKIKFPKHYAWHPSGVECKDIAEPFGYNIGTAIAYLWRHKHKEDPIGDLKKAIRHIEFEIEKLSKGGNAKRLTRQRIKGVLCLQK